MTTTSGGFATVAGEGVLHANPKPYLKSIQAYFPSVAEASNGDLVAAFALGEAFESVDMKTHLARSRDGGATWSLEARMALDAPGRLTSNTARISRAPDGDLLLLARRDDRTDHPDMGLVNPQNLGFVPGEMLLLRSADNGATWGEPALVEPPFPAASLELCTPISVLEDGRWILPCSPWKGWNGEHDGDNRLCVLVSRDGGRSWPEAWGVMRDGKHAFWESRVVELADGRLLAVAWVHDTRKNADLPNQHAVSEDGGRTWSPPRSTGLMGQTMEALALEDGRVLCVYRRMDEPGLWSALARLDGGEWVTEAHQPLWGARGLGGAMAMGESTREMFANLRFGAPHILALGDGGLLLTFWCHEGGQSVIRWMRLEGPIAARVVAAKSGNEARLARR